MVCSMTRSMVKVMSPSKLEIRSFSTAISTIYNLLGNLNSGTISKFDRAGFLMFGLVFASRYFEVGTNVSCKESTISLVWADLLLFIFVS